MSAIERSEPRSSLLDLKDAAARLGVHYNTLLQWVHAGAIVGIRLNGRHKIQIREEDLEAFIERSAIGGTAPSEPSKPPKRSRRTEYAKSAPYAWMED